MFFKELPDVKFGQKSFKQTLEKNEELQKVFAKHSYDILSTYLSDTKASEAEGTTVSDNILAMFNQFANPESNEITW